jgi:hypothetical protein
MTAAIKYLQIGLCRAESQLLLDNGLFRNWDSFRIADNPEVGALISADVFLD